MGSLAEPALLTRHPQDDERDATLPRARTLRYLFHRQALHAALAALLAIAAWRLAAPEPGSGGEYLGVPDRTWFALSIAVAIAHQALVALVFRVQLGWAPLRRLFGRHDLLAWGAVFVPLLVARPLSIYAVARADAGSLHLPGSLPLAIALLVPSAYAAFSVARWFGLPRALGGDHFRVAYREMPLVRSGAFAWTSNAMYDLVFLALWSIALLARSEVGLAAALFQHAFIYAHWFCTEKPDLDLMTGPSAGD